MKTKIKNNFDDYDLTKKWLDLISDLVSEQDINNAIEKAKKQYKPSYTRNIKRKFAIPSESGVSTLRDLASLIDDATHYYISQERGQLVIILFSYLQESEKDYNKRIGGEVKSQINWLYSNRKSKLEKSEQKKLRDKKTLVRLIKDFGPEIYNVFEEINKEPPTK